MQTATAAYQLYRDLAFTNADRQVIEWLCEHIDDGNKVYEITHDRIARTCKLRRATVSEAMKKFEENKLFRKLAGRAGVVALNPRYWYQGLLDEQKRAVEQWDRWQWDDMMAELAESMSQEISQEKESNPDADR